MTTLFVFCQRRSSLCPSCFRVQSPTVNQGTFVGPATGYQCLEATKLAARPTLSFQRVLRASTELTVSLLRISHRVLKKPSRPISLQGWAYLISSAPYTEAQLEEELPSWVKCHKKCGESLEITPWNITRFLLPCLIESINFFAQLVGFLKLYLGTWAHM